MDIRMGVRGMSGGLAYSAVANLGTAEVGQILAAASGLVRSLALASAGALGLGIAVGAAFLYLSSLPVPKVPLSSSMVSITTDKRRFCGISLDENVEVTCDNQDLTIPLSILNRFWVKGVLTRRPVMELIDGSLYEQVELKSKIRFVTIAGIQTVQQPSLHDVNFTVQSATTQQIGELRSNLSEALSHNIRSIRDAIGPDLLERYFKSEQFSLAR